MPPLRVQCRLFVLAMIVAAAAWGPSLAAGDDDKKIEKVIPAPEARNHVGKEGTFEMKVKSSKNVSQPK